MERWSVDHRAFAVETYFVGTSIFTGTNVPSRNTSSSEDISRASCTKRTKENGGFETEYQGRSGNSFSQHAATSDADLQKRLGECVDKGRHLTDTILRK